MTIDPRLGLVVGDDGMWLGRDKVLRRALFFPMQVCAELIRAKAMSQFEK